MTVAGVAHETYVSYSQSLTSKGKWTALCQVVLVMDRYNSIETFQLFTFGKIPYLFVHVLTVVAITPIAV